MEFINQVSIDQTARYHADNPQNMGPLDNFNGHAKIKGPCGDTMEFWLLTDEGRVKKVSFITDGCDSSIACGSVTTCLALEKSIEEAIAITQKDILDRAIGLPEDHKHCALLAVSTLAAACEDYLEKQTQEENKKSGK